MNQILITEKLYVTPELKRKKKIYQSSFIISIFLIIMLCSAYVYAQYDRNKSEELSQDILASMIIEEEILIEENIIQEDTTTISKDNKIWVIDLQATSEEDYEPKINIAETNTSQNQQISQQNNQETQNKNNKEKNKKVIGKYTAPDGTTYNTLGTVSIPSLDVKYPILSETSEKLLKVSVCKFWGANPNEVGNLCIAGHNYRNKKFFSKVPNMNIGDIIEITDLKNKKIKYKVYSKYKVKPDDVSCTSQLTNGKKIVTLITCTDNSKERVIVKAEAI